MTQPLTLRVMRPFATREEFLGAEGCCLDLREVLLIDPALPGDEIPPSGRLVRFQLSLSDGTVLLKAEGLSAAPPDAAALRARLGAIADAATRILPVRLKRYGSKSKQLLEDAIRQRRLRSGVHEKPGVAPSQRDALLARLRARISR